MTKKDRISWLKSCTDKQRREYYGQVAALNCLICGRPAEVHHCYGLNFPAKRPHRPCVPLCFHHHMAAGDDGIHGGRESWEQRWDTQDNLLTKTEMMLERRNDGC